MPADPGGMRGGFAIVVAVVVLACSFAAASTDAATNGALETHVELQLKSLARPATSSRPSTQQNRRQTRSAMAALEQGVIAGINQVRRGRGLRPLRTNARLAAAGDFHSRDMAGKGYFEHDSANGTAFWRRIERFYPSRGFRSWTVGENLFWASQTYGPGLALREWMNSPPHRENILSREWREVGVGAVTVASAPGEYRGRAVTILTADFGARR